MTDPRTHLALFHAGYDADLRRRQLHAGMVHRPRPRPHLRTRRRLALRLAG